MNYLQRVIWKNSSFFWGGILLLWSGNALSQTSVTETLGISGSLRASYWDQDKSFSNQQGFVASSVWLTLRPEEVLGFKPFFEGYFQNDNSLRSNVTEGEVREAYVEKSLGPLDLKIGRQIIIWGRADKANPTDNLTTKNLNRLMVDDEDQRLGIFSTQFIYNLGEFRFIGIWLPEWRTPHYPIPQTPKVRLESEDPENPERQIAFKVDHTGGSVDASLSYFSGYNKVPDLELVLVQPEELRLALIHRPFHVWGGDFATNWGDYGIRGEIAYSQTADILGDEPFQQNSMIDTVLGGDRTVMENFNLNVQFLQRHVMNYHPPSQLKNPFIQALAKQAALNSNQQYQDQTGITVRPSYKALNETLEMEIAYVAWNQNHDSFIRPKISYRVSDQLTLLAGGERYQGPKNSFFGRLKELSTSFTEIRWFF